MEKSPYCRSFFSQGQYLIYAIASIDDNIAHRNFDEERMCVCNVFCFYYYFSSFFLIFSLFFCIQNYYVSDFSREYVCVDGHKSKNFTTMKEKMEDTYRTLVGKKFETIFMWFTFYRFCPLVILVICEWISVKDKVLKKNICMQLSLLYKVTEKSHNLREKYSKNIVQKGFATGYKQLVCFTNYTLKTSCRINSNPVNVCDDVHTYI